MRTADGREIRRGAVVRADHLDRLSSAGWAALFSHGVRTVVDLRNTDESPPDPPARVAVTTVRVPLEDGLAGDPEFVGWMTSGLFGTPLYYRGFLRRWPDRCAAAVAAVARAAPGGVVVHCGKGCDRTGLVVMLLLSICGVTTEDVAADYLLTAERLRSSVAANLGQEDDHLAIQAVLDRESCPSLRSAIVDTLASVDIPGQLRDGGLTDTDITAVRRRLLTQ